MAFTVTTPPLYGQGGSYSAQMDRLLVKATANTAGVRKHTANATPSNYQTGDLAVTPGGTAGTVDVAAGEVMLAGLTSAGYYFAVNDAAINLGPIGSNGTGSTRIDLVVIRVTDTGASPTITAAVVTGTPGGGTPAPTVTSTTIETPLASITLPAGYGGGAIPSGNITDLRRKAFLPDLSVNSTSSTVIPSPVVGNLVFDDVLNQWKYYDGSAWQMMQATEVLCTNATRPTTGLFDGLTIYETDTNRLYRHNGTAFISADAPFICTSTTRPTAGLYDGMVIYETDTNETLTAYNTATTTVWRRPWRQPWGIIGQVNVTASQTGITAVVDLTSLSITWTAVANRRYRATFNGTFQVATGAANDTFVLAYTDNGTPTTIHQHALVFPTTSYQHVGTVLTAVETGLAAGSITRKLRLSRFSGTGTGTLAASSTEPAQFIIEDIGPNGAPA